MSILEEINPKAHLTPKEIVMKTIDIFNNENAFEKFKSESGIELVFTLLKKGKIKSVSINQNNNWIGITTNKENLLCGQFYTKNLIKLFKEMYVDHQDSIIMMLSFILTNIPIEKRDYLRNFIIDLIR